MGTTVRAVAVLALSVAVMEEPRAETVVSLSFDDGTVGQEQAGAVLAARGLRATFFVITGQVGHVEYLDWPAIAALAAQGHEIGGHTISHPALAKLGAAAQKHEICDGRAELLQRGFDPIVFAYPHDSYDSGTEQIAQGCGFVAARASSGLRSVTGCRLCPATESLPPMDRFAIRTPASIEEGQGLDVLEGYVEQAVQAGGGWMPLTFHRICEGCGRVSTPLPILTAFADWLAARVQDGTVVVRPIGDVVQGVVDPPAAVPQAAAPPPAVPPPEPPGKAARATGGCSAGAVGPGSIATAALLLAAIRCALRTRSHAGRLPG